MALTMDSGYGIDIGRTFSLFGHGGGQ